MKKVLILAYDFPPYNSIGGQRPYSWLKYLKEFGYEPTVVTRHWDENIQNEVDYIRESQKSKVERQNLEDGFVWRAPFKPNIRDKIIIKYGLERFSFVRKMLTLFYMLTEFFIPLFDNKYTIYKLANKVLSQEKFDVIIATGEPFILFKYAKNLSKKHKLPWVADYRDGWTTNYLRNIGVLNSRLNKYIFKKLEKKYISTSKFITTAAPIYKEQLAEIHKEKFIGVIFNGFFEDFYDEISPMPNYEFFEISYAGQMYDYQPIEEFLNAMLILIEENPLIKIRINFYGLSFYKSQLERVQKFNKLKGYLNFTDRMPRQELFVNLSKSSLLLLLGRSEEERLPAKIFDYLPLKKKILLVFNDNGILNKIISETNSGIITESIQDIVDVISKEYVLWENSQNIINEAVDYEKYSRKNQTKELALLFDSKLLGYE